jgi:hypothetical protein
LVPYSGATGDVALGLFDITAHNLSGTNTGDQDMSNVATEATQLAILETNALLRRVVKFLEPSATSDSRNRQRVVLDGIGTGTTGITTELAATLPVTVGSSVVNVSAGTSVIQNPISAAPPYTTAATVVQPVFEGPVDQRFRVMEDSRISYQMGIRSHLSFS